MRIDYRELKQRVRVKDLLREMGWTSTEGRGDQLRGPCPLPSCHSSESNRSPVKADRSFSVHIGKNVYQCFRCGSSGNVIDFWRTYRGTSQHEAAKELSRRSPMENTSGVLENKQLKLSLTPTKKS